MVVSLLHTDLFILWSYMCKTPSCRICSQRLFCQIGDLILTPVEAAYNKRCYTSQTLGPCGPCSCSLLKILYTTKHLRGFRIKKACTVHLVHAKICKYVFRQVNAKNTGQVVSKWPSFAIRPLSKEVAPPGAPSHCLQCVQCIPSLMLRMTQ